MGDTPFGFAGDRAAHRGRDGLLRAMRRTGGRTICRGAVVGAERSGRNGLPELGRLPFAGRAALFHRPDAHLGYAFQLPHEAVDVGLFLDFAVVVGVKIVGRIALTASTAWSTVIV